MSSHKPDPLRPVIHTTHPFWLSSFCLSDFPTGHSCQNIFVEFPKEDIEDAFSWVQSLQLNNEINNSENNLLNNEATKRKWQALKKTYVKYINSRKFIPKCYTSNGTIKVSVSGLHVSFLGFPLTHSLLPHK